MYKISKVVYDHFINTNVWLKIMKAKQQYYKNIVPSVNAVYVYLLSAQIMCNLFT